MRPMTASSSSMPDAVAPDPLRSDVRTIGLIGLAHGSSHFFHLLLPPLFPWLIAEFGYSYAELSVMVSLFFVVSGVGQADRKSTRLNSSHLVISYAVFCLKKKKKRNTTLVHDYDMLPRHTDCAVLL